MKKEYRKSRESGNNNLFFENLAETEGDWMRSNSLEAIARNGAQKMIQAMLEDEVTEFLQRLRYEKIKNMSFAIIGTDITKNGPFQRRWAASG